jgi:hypothetical protein
MANKKAGAGGLRFDSCCVRQSTRPNGARGDRRTPRTSGALSVETLFWHKCLASDCLVVGVGLRPGRELASMFLRQIEPQCVDAHCFITGVRVWCIALVCCQSKRGVLSSPKWHPRRRPFKPELGPGHFDDNEDCWTPDNPRAG